MTIDEAREEAKRIEAERDKAFEVLAGWCPHNWKPTRRNPCEPFRWLYCDVCNSLKMESGVIHWKGTTP
jgi:hypothetical protein